MKNFEADLRKAGIKASKQPGSLISMGPKHTFMSGPAFHLSTNEAELYILEISKLDENKTEGQLDSQILKEYEDLQDAFSEKASNDLPNDSGSDMKIEYKEGQEPRNMGLRPMSPVELEEL